MSVILNECEGSITVVRKTARCHPSNRFFTPCYHSVSCFSHTEFLPPFTNDRNQKGLLVSGIKAWGDAGNGTEGRYECLLLSTDFFLYFLYTKGRTVLFL